MSWCCGSENEKRIKRRRENNQNSKRQDNKYYIEFCANPDDLKAHPIYTWMSNDFFDNKDQRSFYGQPMHIKNNKNGQNRPKQVQVNYNANNAQKAFPDNLRPKNFAEQYKDYPFMHNYSYQTLCMPSSDLDSNISIINNSNGIKKGQTY